MSIFANSGAEAVENAVKIVRYAKSRPAVICFENAFYGQTPFYMITTGCGGGIWLVPRRKKELRDN